MSKTTARARANARELGDVPTQLAALEQMNVGQLAEEYRELYGEPTRTRNKEYLRKRLAWRIQELAEGGLSASALERIAQLGDDVPERWRMRQAAQVQDLGTVQPTEPRDPRVPPVGTVLRRVFNGVAHEVTVCSEGFEHGGERFKTLSVPLSPRARRESANAVQNALVTRSFTPAALSARTLSTRASCSRSVEGRGNVGEKRNGPGDRSPRPLLKSAGSRFRDPA